MAAKAKTKAPEQTLEESRYLKKLVEDRTTIRLKMANNEEVEGVIEFFDANFIRLTRVNAPNLFIYKHDIKYLHEVE